MSKRKKNMRQLRDAYNANRELIRELNEKRELTDADKAQLEALDAQNAQLYRDIRDASVDYMCENPAAKADAEKVIRENVKHNRRTEIQFVRDIMMVSDIEDGAVIPLNVQDILRPLVEGFILDKVGLPMPTGLHGDFVWPVFEMVEATVLDEGAELGSTKIPFSKLTANPARIGIAVPVSNQSLNQTNGLLETIVREIMPAAVRQLLNKVICSPQAVNAAAASHGLVGPYVAAMATAVDLEAEPSFKKLNGMKAEVLSTGIDGEHLCWTMTKGMAAKLEGLPINSKGIFVPMLQNGTLCGLPVYTSNETAIVQKKYKKAGSGSNWADYTLTDNDTVTYHVSGDTEAHALAKISGQTTGQIAEVKVVTEFIGLGDWRYQPMGLFGDLRFIVDPYSQARKDAVDFVLNCDFATKTLRPEAFLIGRVAPVAD